MAQQTHGAHMGGPRGAAGMMPGEKAKNFKGTMAKLLRYLSRYLPAIITVLVCAAASTVFSIFGPKVLGQATTKLFEGVMAMLTGTGGIDFTAIGQILLFLLAIYLASVLLSYVRRVNVVDVTAKIRGCNAPRSGHRKGWRACDQKEYRSATVPIRRPWSSPACRGRG